jgi:hypothetical protein
MQIQPADPIGLAELSNARLVELIAPGTFSEMQPLHMMVNVREFEHVAKARMTAAAYDYVTAGAEDEV